MSKIVRFKSILVYSPERKGFFYDLNHPLLIIHGANTSGKSTLIQTILYIFGINEMNKYMESIYSDMETLRLDIEIMDGDDVSHVILIRRGGSIKIKKNEDPIVEFNDISSNNSSEHARFKHYLRTLFSYDLKLFSVDSYKDASIETCFLPYYIPQSVGWVSIRKAFDGLEYYKNFREDFINYCMGISNADDLEEKDKIEKEINTLSNKIEAIESTKVDNDKKIITRLKSDLMPTECIDYIQNYNKEENDLIGLNLEHTKQCNELALLKAKEKVLREVKKNLKAQDPENGGICPICNRPLDSSLVAIYEHMQYCIDTNEELKDISDRISKANSAIDSLQKKIDAKRLRIEREREVFEALKLQEDISVKEWIDSRVQSEVSKTLDIDLMNYRSQIQLLQEKRKEFKSNDDIKKEQSEIESKFLSKFLKGLIELDVDYCPFKSEDRFFKLYKISALPYQGTELLEALMAYHFAFNELVREQGMVVRLPFMLDAIFKEDIDIKHRRDILKFISNHLPSDTQLIFSMADQERGENQLNAETCNVEFFNNKARLLFTSNEKKNLMKPLGDGFDKLIEETEEF